MWDMSVSVMTLIQDRQAFSLTLVRRPQEVADVIEGIYQFRPCELLGFVDNDMTSDMFADKDIVVSLVQQVWNLPR